MLGLLCSLIQVMHYIRLGIPFYEPSCNALLCSLIYRMPNGCEIIYRFLKGGDGTKNPGKDVLQRGTTEVQDLVNKWT